MPSIITVEHTGPIEPSEAPNAEVVPRSSMQGGVSNEPSNVTRRNRRKAYLDEHPEYFSSALELADPLLYERLVRRFQSASEREAEGRAKGFSGLLEADMRRFEAKVDALARPGPSVPTVDERGPDGALLGDTVEEIPQTRDEGEQRWRTLMTWRFLRGDDGDFDYALVDGDDSLDNQMEQRQDAEDAYYSQEEPSFILGGAAEEEEEEVEVKEEKKLSGQTGIQDF